MISEDKRVTLHSIIAPRIRYYEEAPEHLSVPVADLLARLPAQYRSSVGGGDHQGRMIQLPCQELFRGNTPRLSLSLLHSLLPDLVQWPEGDHREELIPLPPGWLALHFHLITRREELPPEPVVEPPQAEEKKTEALLLTTEEESLTEKNPPIISGTMLPACPMPPQEETLLCSADLPASSELQAALKEEPKESIAEDAAAIPPSATVLMQSAPLGGEKKRGFFASLPIFRRHQAPSSLPTKPILPPLPMPLQESVVTPHLSPDVSFVREITPSPPIFPSRKPSETEGKLSAPKLERLWKLDPQDPLADPTALQSLFMTEEKLTLERVIFLAGQLPGLRACVLAHGDQVVSASNIPEGIDLRTLSREAMTMLSQLRDSSATMGLGGVPAITLHGEQGVLSFLYQGKICLLVLHADRGFLPGVRERLQEMLGHLSSAKSVLESHNTQPNLPI